MRSNEYKTTLFDDDNSNIKIIIDILENYRQIEMIFDKIVKNKNRTSYHN